MAQTVKTGEPVTWLYIRAIDPLTWFDLPEQRREDVLSFIAQHPPTKKKRIATPRQRVGVLVSASPHNNKVVW